MGKCPPPGGCGGGGGGGGGGCGGGTSGIIAVLNQILNIVTQLLQQTIAQYSAGGVNSYTDLNPNGTVGTTAALLYKTSKPVRKAIIQNLSTTDNYTITASGSKNRTSANSAVGAGIILNKANASGQGGGSLTVNNTDLSELTIISDTNTGQNVVVYYEVGANIP